jgi:CxxC-x17-CxxC domain-containing protein
MYIIGKTGMGKTTLLEHLVMQDIQNGHGVAYVDPHGDTAEKIISMIPPERIKDVIYFNPSDQAFPIAFNVMEKVSAEDRPIVASGLIGVFKKLWADSWGPRLEYILRNAILALLEYPDSTLLGVMRILNDRKYRDKVVANVTDPMVKAFWVDEFSRWSDKVLQEVVSPIQNKVGQFLSTSLIRNIVGQTQSSFSVRQAMDEKKILILNLSKGRIGEDSSALIGAMMITKVQLAAMGRVDIPEDQRSDFYLYVDEFQNFATESFANILSEARKYRLNLILANQYITQIDEIVRDAIFGNVGTMISFRVGAADAEFLEKEYEPVFMMNDIVNLPKYDIYLKLMIDGIAGDAFSATTLPPVSITNGIDTTDQVRQNTREKYASSQASVEEGIIQWSGMTINPESPGAVGPGNTRDFRGESAADRPASQGRSAYSDAPVEKRTLYDAKCDNCSVAIQVPFKPDGSRPTFCKECLKEYQRKVARKREQGELPEAGRESANRGYPREANRERRPNQERIRVASPSENAQDVSKVVFATQNEPMKLSQLQYVAPKKFVPLRDKTAKREDIREFIQQVKNEKPGGVADSASEQ